MQKSTKAQTNHHHRTPCPAHPEYPRDTHPTIAEHHSRRTRKHCTATNMPGDLLLQHATATCATRLLLNTHHQHAMTSELQLAITLLHAPTRCARHPQQQHDSNTHTSHKPHASTAAARVPRNRLPHSPTNTSNTYQSLHHHPNCTQASGHSQRTPSQRDAQPAPFMPVAFLNPDTIKGAYTAQL